MIKSFFKSPTISGLIFGLAIAEVFKAGLFYTGIALCVSTILLVVVVILNFESETK
jgi:uncharacterized protein YacL